MANEIEYIFYEKPMKSMLVIGKESALPFNVKMKSLTQEVFRRLHNTRMTQMESHRTPILTKFMAKMKASGYTALDRLKVLEGGFNTFDRIKKLEEEGKRLFYRPPSVRDKERKKKKENEKEWFKSKKEDAKSKKCVTVILVEATPNSELVRKLREMEEKHKIDDNY